jgi:hypothetical protein
MTGNAICLVFQTADYGEGHKKSPRFGGWKA